MVIKILLTIALVISLFTNIALEKQACGAASRFDQLAAITQKSNDNGEKCVVQWAECNKTLNRCVILVRGYQQQLKK